MAAIPDWKQLVHEPAPSSGLPVETVLVPLDGREASKAALPVARVIAQFERATLHILYVGQRLRGPQETLEQLGLTPEEIRGAVLDHLTGEPGKAIQAIAERLPSPLMVMCTHTGPHRQGASLGAIARAVLGTVPERILLVRPERGNEPWRMRRVLLAHDGTPSAGCAIGPTTHLAHRAGAEVTAVHVASRKSVQPTEPGSLLAPRYMDQPHHEWPVWANEFVERMLALGHTPSLVNFKLLVTGGQPGSEIAQTARDNRADLVVLPWHGRWESQRVNAVKVIVRNCGCPVLLIQCTAQPTTPEAG